MKRFPIRIFDRADFAVDPNPLGDSPIPYSYHITESAFKVWNPTGSDSGPKLTSDEIASRGFVPGFLNPYSPKALRLAWDGATTPDIDDVIRKNDVTICKTVDDNFLIIHHDNLEESIQFDANERILYRDRSELPEDDNLSESDLSEVLRILTNLLSTLTKEDG